MSIKVQNFSNKAYDEAFAKGVRSKVTLFTAFYNNVDFFKKVFASIEVQNFQDFEMIICDDGSKPEAAEAIRNIYEKSAVPVKHIWHEDRGFYKNEALNRGVLEARSEYFVFIDADCVLHPDFIGDHWNNRQEGRTLAGRRVNLTPFISQNLSVERIKCGYLQKNWWWLFLTMFWMKDNNSTKGFRVVRRWLYQQLNRKPRGLVGCNFSVSKKDLLQVNGFDMTYFKPGIGEDSDIDFRLSGIGVTPKPLCFQGIQYHLYHKLQMRSEANEAKFAELKKSKKYITDFGIKELEKELQKELEKEVNK